MRRDELIRSERRRANWALAAVVGAALLATVGQIIAATPLSEIDREDGNEVLLETAASSGQILAGKIMAGLAFALLLVPLLLLFDAARARTGGRMDRFRLLVAFGPMVVALSQVLTAIAVDNIAEEFAAGAGPIFGEAGEERADELRADSGLFAISQSIGLAGFLALVFGLVYSSLWAMRSGLLTRFWGTLGMAFGVLILIGGPVGLLGTLFFLLYVALVAADRWIGTQPPAWAAGEAVPWDERDAERFGFGRPREEAGEELADPAEFEQLEGVPPPEGEAEDRADGDSDSERPGRRDNRRKRKRKQRRR